MDEREHRNIFSWMLDLSTTSQYRGSDISILQAVENALMSSRQLTLLVDNKSSELDVIRSCCHARSTFTCLLALLAGSIPLRRETLCIVIAECLREICDQMTWRENVPLVYARPIEVYARRIVLGNVIMSSCIGIHTRDANMTWLNSSEINLLRLRARSTINNWIRCGMCIDTRARVALGATDEIERHSLVSVPASVAALPHVITLVTRQWANEASSA